MAQKQPLKPSPFGGNDVADLSAIDACFAQVKTLLEEIVTQLGIPAGIETSFGQLGCIWDRTVEPAVQTASILVCKISPEAGGEAVTQVHAYYTDGTIDLNYQGSWEPCSDDVSLLEDIKELLTCPPAVAAGVLTTWN